MAISNIDCEKRYLKYAEEKSKSMIIEKRKLGTILLQSLTFFLSLFVILGVNYEYSLEGFKKIGFAGSLIIVLQIVVYIIYEGAIITPFFCVLVCFVLFQFGLPILYALIPDYHNFYVEFLDINNVINGAKYSVIAIETFIIGASFGMGRGKSIINLNKQFLSNERMIQQTAKTLFWCTGAIAVPINIIVLLLSMRYGYSYVKGDTMGLYNGLTNFAKTVFVASGFLTIVYTGGKKKKLYIWVLLLYGILSMASGGRTEGLPIFLAFILMLMENKKRNNYIIRYLIVVLVVFVMLYILASLAQTRVGNSYEIKSILAIIVDVVQEMGFNFTSICFTMIYVPGHTKYQMGSSYLGSLIALIPQSTDILGIRKLFNTSAEIWLAKQLSVSYGNLFNFGVGYSVIAESFFNFGWAGIIAVGIQGFLIQKLFALKMQGNPKFAQYIQLIMVYGLTTYSRRSFYTLEKVIEYDVLLIMLILYFCYNIKQKKRHS